MVLALSATASLHNHPISDSPFHCSTQSRGQLFSGFEPVGLKMGLEANSGRNLIAKIAKLQCRCLGFQDYEANTGNDAAKEKAVEDIAVGELIAAVIRQAEVEGSLTQAFKRISIEDWSKVLSNVGRKHWELALGIFGIFKETSTIFLRSNGHVDHSRNVLKVYTTMVAVLAKHGRLEEAESILTEAQQLGYRLDLFLYNAFLGGYARKGMAKQMLECMVQMHRAGIEPDCLSYEQLIAAYLNNGKLQLGLAIEVLDYMVSRSLKPSFKTYCELINACCQSSFLDGAEKCFSAMVNGGYTPDVKIFHKMMQLSAQEGDHNRTEELFQMLKQAGIQPTATCYEHVLHAYCKAGQVNLAFTVFRESKQVCRPSLLVYNMLLDACSSSGFHLQALQLFNEILHSGMKANAVTFTAAITALVRSGRYTKAEELYRKMLKHRISPTVDTYTSMIDSYTARGWTRLGHELCLIIRTTDCVITSVAYNAMLNLYLRGGWYTEGAEVLKEMDGKGLEPCVASYGALISSCGDSSPALAPVIKALQWSQWETCQMIHLLLFQPIYEKPESLLEGNSIELPGEVLEFLKTMAETRDEHSNMSFYNAMMGSMWRRGLKRRAKSVMLVARGLLPWYNRPRSTKSKLLLELRGLSLGASQVALLDFVANVVHAGLEEDVKVVLVTGTGNSSSRLQRDNDVATRGKPAGSDSTHKAIKKAVNSTLAELGSPFMETPPGSGRLVAGLSEVVVWRSLYGISSALMLDNVRPYSVQ